MKLSPIIFSLLVSIFIFTGGTSYSGGSVVMPDSAAVCIVSGETIEGDGVKYKYLDKQITFCCEGCEKKFKKEPASYLKDGLKCPVCDEPDAKKELSTVVNGTKYYFCGDGCKKKFELDPDMYFNQYNK